MVTQKLSGKLHRISGADASTAEVILQAATVLLVPEDRTNRKAFESLMPYLYVLRHQGHTWIQLTKLLRDCGFRLQQSTVRSYYSEILAAQPDIGKALLPEHLLLLTQISKKTEGANLSGNRRVSTLMNP